MAKIGIIGGGYTGLGVGYYLKDLTNHEVTIIEHNNFVGGLASGIKVKEWEWPVDKVIHHFFTSDSYALGIAKEIGMGDKLIIKDTKSSCYYNGKIAELDSPFSLLKFPFISFINRLRTGLVMFWIRLDKNYLKYEKITSFNFIKKYMGKNSFEVIWKPLFNGKFGKYAEQINAAWFWARIHPRTKNLAYIGGGFQTYADKIADEIKKSNAKIMLNSKIRKIKHNNGKFEVFIGKKKFIFDIIVFAVPLQVALKLFKFPKEYYENHSQLKSIGAQYFVLELNHSFLDDGTYWLNVNDETFPFMMVAEHTNFIDKKYYNNKHIIWVGKYLDYDDKLWQLSEDKFLEMIIPCLKKINPRFERSWINRSFFTRFTNAQPILPLNYSKMIPPIETPIKNLFIANMNHIYPWDRGTNQALWLGEKVANILKNNVLLKNNK